jgi:hypothetical protein
MTKKDGKLHEAVVEKLRSEGIDVEGIEVATLCRGCDHLILRDGETIGEYNHRSKKLTLYSN